MTESEEGREEALKRRHAGWIERAGIEDSTTYGMRHSKQCSKWGRWGLALPRDRGEWCRRSCSGQWAARRAVQWIGVACRFTASCAGYIQLMSKLPEYPPRHPASHPPSYRT